LRSNKVFTSTKLFSLVLFLFFVVSSFGFCFLEEVWF
jgi:hypothetical protein